MSYLLNDDIRGHALVTVVACLQRHGVASFARADLRQEIEALALDPVRVEGLLRVGVLASSADATAALPACGWDFALDPFLPGPSQPPSCLLTLLLDETRHADLLAWFNLARPVVARQVTTDPWCAWLAIQILDALLTLQPAVESDDAMLTACLSLPAPGRNRVLRFLLARGWLVAEAGVCRLTEAGRTVWQEVHDLAPLIGHLQSLKALRLEPGSECFDGPQSAPWMAALDRRVKQVWRTGALGHAGGRVAGVHGTDDAMLSRWGHGDAKGSEAVLQVALLGAATPADCHDLFGGLPHGVEAGQGLMLMAAHGRQAEVDRGSLDAGSAFVDGLFEALHMALGRRPATADELLLTAAGHGWFPKPGWSLAGLSGLPLARISLHLFEARSYRIRMAAMSDLPDLRALEQRCWPAGLQADEAILKQRLERFPKGQLVLEVDGEVAGAMYSQRIVDPEAILQRQSDDVHTLHESSGNVIQLLAVNVRPELQDRNLGDQLLEFMLLRCELLDGVRKVVAVTRCKDRAQHPEVSAQDYIRLRNGRGRLVDSVLRFHELHGAQISRIVAGYRPADHVNEGHGVLVEYDIRHRQRDEIDAEAGRAGDSPRGQDIAELVDTALRELLSRPEAFAADRPLMEMGLDSADLLQLAERLSAGAGLKLSPTFFFRYNTSERIVLALREQIERASGEAKPVAPGVVGLAAGPDALSDDDARAVAIVGVSCRLPGGVNDLDGLWALLCEERETITDLPAGRWAWPSEVEVGGRHRGIDRGSFMHDIDCFDAEFFRITPREAELMDPQQRILLELSWACFEQAGHAPRSMAGSRTGVYVGASGSDYQNVLSRRGIVEPHSGQATSMAILANRLSYFFDFHGPSLQIDTACSSSLVAVHEAVRALRDGGCSQALVAGINVMLNPATTMAYHKAGMLSPDGRCKTFDAQANGYVRGEGAVVVLLKTLRQARLDGDRLHAVIRGSAVNHGGQAGGLTVPHPSRQADLLVAAMEDARIEPGRLGYIEAHGTGTSLGDPIEVQGIKEALGRMGSEGHPVGLGSIKTNLGHLEAAAGLAGLLKVLLSLRHGTLPASRNFQRLNPQIDLGGTGLHVVDRARPWARAPHGGLRVAGLSSFGSGGTNAHLVVEEARADARIDGVVGQPVIVMLSARSAEQRQAQADLLLSCLRTGAWRDQDLADVAGTLRVGREAMSARLACVAASMSELIERLARHVEGEHDVPGLYAGEVRAPKAAPAPVPNHVAMLAEVHAQAWAWVHGAGLPEAPPGSGRRRLELPTYPFARERHWVAEVDAAPDGQALSALHPLLHENSSTFGEQRFSSRFTGREYFLRDHVVQGRPLLPGVAQIEMAREAATRAFGQQALVHLKSIVFKRPVVVGEAGLQLHVSLADPRDGQADFEIWSELDGQELVHTEGRVVVVEPLAQAPSRDMEALRASMVGLSRIDAVACYAALADQGLVYGSAMQALQSVFVDAGEGRPARLLAQVELPETVAKGGACHLHPSLLDAALQAVLLALPGQATGRPHLPFSVESVRVHAALPPTLWVSGRARAGAGASSDIIRWDLEVLGMDGRLCAELDGFAFRRVQASPLAAEAMMMRPVWRDQVVAPELARRPRGSHWLLAEEGPLADALAVHLPSTTVVRLPVADEGRARFAAQAACLMDLLHEVLRRDATEEVLVQVLALAGDGSSMAAAGLSGMLLCAHQEAPRLLGQVLEASAEMTPAELARWLNEQALLAAAGQARVRHHEGRTRMLGFEVAMPVDSTPLPLSEPGGVYLITGGGGGLGLALGRAMVADTPNITLVLTGRSTLSDERVAEIDAWRRQGTRVRYERVDVSDGEAMRGLVRAILADEGRIDGVLHAAGALRDSLLVNKTQADLALVLAPKVDGLVALDRALGDARLSYAVAFSSISSVLGNLGQADYAAANGFMDAYMAHRQSRVDQGACHGRSFAVNWPLWAEGGMTQDESGRGRSWHALGLTPLPTAVGIQALKESLASGGAGQVVVLHGQPDQIVQLTRGPLVAPSTAPGAAAPMLADGDAQALRGKAVRHLTQLVAKQLKLPLQRIEVSRPLEQYGLDSVLAVALVNAMEADFGALPKTMFFEHPTIEALADHLVQAHPDVLARLFGVVPPRAPALASAPPGARDEPAQGRAPTRRARGQRDANVAGAALQSADIAVIGMSGRFAQAPDLAALWDKLLQGADCVTEVPANRWDHALYFDAEKGQPGKSYCRWGGFIEGIDEFDPLFFNMSPAEAQVQDPHIRVWLETVAHLLESAGHTRRVLAGYQGRVGMYVGSMYQQYRGAGNEPGQDALMSLNMASTIANRASYHFGLEGPSIAVDTMCTSSFVALLQACKDLQLGDCDLAIAGGVSLTPHPDKYVGLSQWQYLASSGEHRSFGQGDGYLPSEGVGAVLLKPLAKARADGDDILAVIKGGASVHSGRAQGYGVPSLGAQARVMAEALRRSAVDPATVSYVEAAANGSALGDAIEVSALTRVFEAAARAGQRIALGAVKSNLGHPEAASGMAQLAKVILQMRHRKLVPTIKSEPLNPDLRLAQGPFVLQRELADWPSDLPRRALINAVGAGGVCASIVVEEAPDEAWSALDADVPTQAEVMVFSARSRERLVAVVKTMLDHLARHPEVPLADLAHALQSCKEAHEVRLALVVDGHEALVQGLTDYLKAAHEGQEPCAEVPLFTGDLEEGNGHLQALLAGKVGEALVRSLAEQRDLERIALYWTQGGEVDWSLLQAGTRRPRKVPLPAYPFARQRCWALADTVPDAARAPSSARDADVVRVPAMSGSPAATREAHVADWLRLALAQALRVEPQQIRGGRPMRDLGVDSVQGLRLMRRINESFGVEITGRDLLAHDTVDALSRLVAARSPNQPPPPPPSPAGELSVLEMLRQGLIDLEEADKYFQE